MAYTPTKKLAEKRKKVMFQRLIVSVISVVCIVGSIIFIFHQPNFRIDTIRVTGAVSLSESEVKGVVEKVLTGSYLYVIPRNNTLFYPKQEIVSILHGTFLKILSVEIKRDGLRGVSISVQERSPYALWCGSHVTVSSLDNAKCYFIDSLGLVYAESPVFSNDVYMHYYGGAIGNGNILGAHYLPVVDFRNLDQFVRTLVSVGVETKHIRVYDGDVDMYVLGKADLSPTVLRFSITQPYTKSLSAFNTFISDQTASSTIQKYLASVEYLDFRFGNKIYSKPRK
ncbi:hypothetical protein EPO17_01470 [Patescibacteria group bacterium]|nr:MAG: hypothetical protein EPO17_01470 [Patescibacteria group bacterium]